ncbi:MAG TPA: hypothetical protein ENK00_01810 [Chromatiales bacterium]|nr:hypothetical protein [Chromatiales bacterium]
MAVFPTYGRILLDDYGEEPSPATLRTDMESGPPKQVQVLSRVMVTRTVTVLYTNTEYKNFKTWFRDTVSRGADWFDFVDPVDGVTRQSRIVSSRQQPPYQAKAVSQGEGSPLSWAVSMRIESWDQ